MHIHIKATLYFLPSLFAFQMTGWLRREGIACFGDAAVIAFDIGINSSVRATWERASLLRTAQLKSDSGKKGVLVSRVGTDLPEAEQAFKPWMCISKGERAALGRASVTRQSCERLNQRTTCVPYHRGDVWCTVCSMMWTAVTTKLCLHRSIW